MNNSQLNKSKMFDTVQSVIVHHQAAWNNNVAFTTAYTEFSTKLELLRSLSAEHIKTSKGLTIKNKIVQAKTIDQAMLLANVLGAYALKVGDTKLLVRTIYTRSEWMKGDILLKANRFKNLLYDVQEHEADMLDYGIDTAAIQAFEECLNQFENSTKETRISIVGRKQMTQEIARLIAEINDLLHGQMGRIITVFSSTHANFVGIFKNACVIIDHRGKRQKLVDKQVSKEPDDPSKHEQE